jgi:16S rRNA (guanine527-N7)-methyltransferase
MRKDGGHEQDRAAALSLVPVSRETEAVLERLVSELRRWQAVKNLVGPATLDAVWTRHVADSAQLVDLAPGARTWVDLGSGAGFPGLVVAAQLRGTPGAEVHLVESNARKCAFLRETGRLLNLPVRVHPGRIESILPTLAPADVVSARALAPLPELIALAAPLLKTGSLGIFPKGRDWQAELTDSAQSWRIEASPVPSRVDPDSRILLIRDAQPRT